MKYVKALKPEPWITVRKLKVGHIYEVPFDHVPVMVEQGLAVEATEQEFAEQRKKAAENEAKVKTQKPRVAKREKRVTDS
jgi:hypothetical protein